MIILKIYISLIDNDNDEIIITDISRMKEKTFIKVTDLINGELETLAAFPKEFHSKLDQYKKNYHILQFFNN